MIRGVRPFFFLALVSALFPFAFANCDQGDEGATNDEPFSTPVQVIDTPDRFALDSRFMLLDFFGSTPTFNLTFRNDEGMDTARKARLEFAYIAEYDPSNTTEPVVSVTNDQLPLDFVAVTGTNPLDHDGLVGQINMSGTLDQHPHCVNLSLSNQSCPILLQQRTWMYTQDTSIEFADETINAKPGGIKLAILVDNWPFVSQQNELWVAIRIFSYDPDILEALDIEQLLNPNITTIDFEFEDISVPFRFTFNQNHLSDGQVTPVISISNFPESLSPLVVQLVWKFPSFNTSMHYDPDLGPLLSTDPVESEGECNKKDSTAMEYLYSLIGLVLVPCACLCAVVIIAAICCTVTIFGSTTASFAAYKRRSKLSTVMTMTMAESFVADDLDSSMGDDAL